MECCGNNGADDWTIILENEDPYNELNKTSVITPVSCCFADDCEYHYSEGCRDKLTFIVTHVAVIIAIGALSTAFLHVSSGFIFSFFFFL